MNSGDDPNQMSNDADEFLRAIGDVRRLQHDQADTGKPRPPARARQRDRDEAAAHADWLSDPIGASDLQPGDELRYARNGISQRVFRKLRNGHYRVEDELDMHGMFAEEARQAIALFLDQARERGRLCVRVVHGKGMRSRQKGPVLKGLTDHWLRQRQDVLAFCSAPPTDGGTGAVYVLLKRHAAKPR
ncbi:MULTISPECIES: Smr/MutS family protein [Thioalkalivibrio]|uniref:Smr/MutS family protein n=1 Tax=Thioalkalivibrio TaxID=106633 RepID=UPI00036F641B|nr:MULTISPECIES: Smr/MutS family protein [Thioalkalivibrio]